MCGRICQSGSAKSEILASHHLQARKRVTFRQLYQSYSTHMHWRRGIERENNVSAINNSLSRSITNET